MKNFLEIIAPLVVGWPGIISSIILAIIGVYSRKPVWIIIAAILAIPNAIYLTGSPAIGRAGLLIPAAFLGSAIASRYKRQWLAWVLLFPQLVFYRWLAYTVVTQYQ